MSDAPSLAVDPPHDRSTDRMNRLLKASSVACVVLMPLVLGLNLECGESRGDGPHQDTGLHIESVENSIGMKLLLIPAGTFEMGSPAEPKVGIEQAEGPSHEVEISRPFYLGAYEVTQVEYARVMGHNPSAFAPGGAGSEKVRGQETSRFPVEQVSWDDAVEFCRKLSECPEEKAARRVYRLPTEAEWEYACRGGVKKDHSFNLGNEISSKQANFDGEYPYPHGVAEKGPRLGRTNEVGSYAPNSFGLHDMHGNVWEYCSDWYDVDYYCVSPRKDPPGPDRRDFRVIRGGGWRDPARSCRSASRNREGTWRRIDGLGFRVAVDTPAQD